MIVTTCYLETANNFEAGMSLGAGCCYSCSCCCSWS